MGKKKVIVITGASSGMGKASAELFVKKGWQVYAGARRTDKMKELGYMGVRVLPLDVSKTERNQKFIETVLQEQGRIDILINNAGYGQYGAVEYTDMKQVRQQFEVNVFGAIELSKLVLPAMREQGFGRIINISSIGGDVYMPLGAFYHATKAALQQFSDSLDLEVSQFGIRSVVVQPGGTQSEWSKIAMENARKDLPEDSPYQKLIDSVSTILVNNEGKTTSADLAKVFYKAATDAKAKRRYLNSTSDKMIVWASRTMPNVYKKVMQSMLDNNMHNKKQIREGVRDE
ncbi:short-chain dehydrogenase [Weissella ceti NC36]|uniref:SDR family NAD(P)-dependent oxidoreductase n=1 Tax=Weissella ceti TaxID=759620 RepID=UPI0002AAD7BB|nr:SDR family NAD(P)-dependent oxidoreductase [Weissella ceti]ELA07564.1 short-chain dehydrogenase [Weissella ceti NC36]